MKIYLKPFICLLYLFSNLTHASEDLIIEYAKNIAQINIIHSTYVSVNKKCNTTPSRIMLASINRADYLVRLKTGYSLIEFESAYGDISISKKLTDQLVDLKLLPHTGCKNLLVSALQNRLANYVSDRVNKISTLSSTYSIPNIDRKHSNIVSIFYDKLNKLDLLPIEEIQSLAVSMEIGLYRYSLGYIVPLQTKNIAKAIQLLKYVAHREKSPESYYYLANKQRSTDIKSALKSFNRAASLGHPDAQIWLGAYFSCVNNSEKSNYWLSKVTVDKIDFVNDLYHEIREYGEPYDCSEYR